MRLFVVGAKYSLTFSYRYTWNKPYPAAFLGPSNFLTDPWSSLCLQSWTVDKPLVWKEGEWIFSCSKTSPGMASVDYQKLEDGEGNGGPLAPPFALSKLENDKESLLKGLTDVEVAELVKKWLSKSFLRNENIGVIHNLEKNDKQSTWSFVLCSIVELDRKWNNSELYHSTQHNGICFKRTSTSKGVHRFR